MDYWFLQMPFITGLAPGYGGDFHSLFQMMLQATVAGTVLGVGLLTAAVVYNARFGESHDS